MPHPPTAIPRLDCLGLIEAKILGCKVVYQVLIPRLDCLGLIEASQGIATTWSCRARIPRLDCLGLIEARTCELSRHKARRIPRLDCLGLIEATPSGKPVSQPGLDSEA